MKIEEEPAMGIMRKGNYYERKYKSLGQGAEEIFRDSRKAGW